MCEIRKLNEAELITFAQIVANAYPGIDIPLAEEFGQQLAQIQANDPSTGYYGLFHNGVLRGGMRLFDFRMNLLGVKTLAGGVGLVAVDLLHKKEKVAHDLIRFFLQHYHERGSALTTLYPFRPDFYRKMGFGYGTKMNQYRLKPAQLPTGPSKAHVQLLNADDKAAVLACYQRFVDRTHGMIDRSMLLFDRMFAQPGNRIVGFKQGEQILGYMIFSFKRGEHFAHNDIEVSELVYETSEALSELLTFLHSQADQINAIILHTQDEYFHHIPLDPRNGTGHLLPHAYHESNTSGVGLMYRVIATPEIFRILANHNFGNQTCTLKLEIVDSFFPINEGSTVVAFREGKATLVPQAPADITVRLAVSDFSALLMGAIDFRSLYRYGQATISHPDAVSVVHRLFRTEEKPVCMTRF